MTVIWIFVLLVANPLSLTSTLIHTITNGSLFETWKLNFTIYVGELRGVILFCIDSNKRQFGVELNVGVNHGKDRTIRVIYDRILKEVSLRSLCGCDPCSETLMTFEAAFQGGVVNTTCNANNSVSLTIDPGKNENGVNEEPLNPVPMAIHNTSEKVFIMMGNIGPYAGENHVTVFPRREQMVGCVRAFYYGGESLALNGSGAGLQPSCLHECRANLCNGGLCVKKSYNSVTCDCASTAFNGPYCDRSLRMYVPGGDNSYGKQRQGNQINLKMSWQQLLDKQYCLMEIISTHANVTLSIDKSHLKMASSIISDNNIDGVNFVNVTMTNNLLIVKTRNNVTTLELSLDEKTRIHIGFSETDKRCETFEGAYDLLFDSPLFRQIVPRVEMSEHLKGTTKVPGLSPESNSTQGNMLPASLASASVGCTVLFFVLITVLYLRSRRDMRKHLHQLTVLSSLSLDQSGGMFVETEVYGKVDDAENYDYI